MNILLCNDDGALSDGIRSLGRELVKNHNVIIFAPKDNCSGYSHSLSIGKGVKVSEVLHEDGIKTYAVCGTPADCVYLAHIILKDFKPDLVVTGINNGYNLGSDVYYSGTVGAALQAVICGYKSIAFSTPHYYNYLNECIPFAVDVIKKLLKYDQKVAWNVNFPPINPKEIKGVKFSKIGVMKYSDTYQPTDNENEYILTGEILTHKYNDGDSDVEVIKEGYVSVSPVTLNRTDFDVLKDVIDE